AGAGHRSRGPVEGGCDRQIRGAAEDSAEELEGADGRRGVEAGLAGGEDDRGGRAEGSAESDGCATDFEGDRCVERTRGGDLARGEPDGAGGACERRGLGDGEVAGQ